jgi:hypothetical protein
MYHLLSPQPRCVLLRRGQPPVTKFCRDSTQSKKTTLLTDGTFARRDQSQATLQNCCQHPKYGTIGIFFRISLMDSDTQPHSRARGRPFEKGNGGRRPGSRNRTTLVAEALLKGEEVELVRKAIELAKAGDVPMLKFLLDRILPKERSIRVDLPSLDRSSDAVDALVTVIDAVGSGQVAPSEGSALASLVAAYARLIDIAEFEQRLENTEKQLKELKAITPNASKITPTN